MQEISQASDPFLSVPKAAEKLGAPVSALRRAVKDGLFPSQCPFNSRIRIRLGEIVAAVRRVRPPGVKFDAMMVLEGPQGSGKSTAIEILAGEDNFSDQNVLALDDKAQMEALEGVWIFEIAELDGMRHAETSKLKAFLSRKEDRARPAYARFKEHWPRQCVFIGTTNDALYFKDQTGNRRFWPVKTTRIDLDALRRDRDQIWAEAAHLEAEGRPITLPRKLWSAAEDAQMERLLADPFDDPLSEIRGQVDGGCERVHTKTIFERLDIPITQRKGYHDKQIAAVMRKLGWDGPKKVRVRGVAARGYERPADQRRTDDEDENLLF